MTTGLDYDREDDSPARRINAPLEGDKGQAEYDHRSESKEGDNVGRPETFEDGWDFLEEVGELDFLLGRTPCDVVGEQMGEDSTGKVQT